MYYGFDIGGTKIEFGAFNLKLERIATERIPTPVSDYEQLLMVVVDLVNQYDKTYSCEGAVGIGIPGIEKVTDGTVLTANIPAATGQKLRTDLEKKLGRQVALNNDANCFALSEAWDETLRDQKSVLGLILGTGFGGGLILNGKVISGKNNVAGELGHMRMPIDAWQHLGSNAPLFDCGCGHKGCIDNYLSGRGFEQLYSALYNDRKKAIEIIEQFKAGEQTAVAFVDQYVEMLAMVFGSIMTAIDPDVVVLGGGLSNFDYLYEVLPQRLSKYLLPIATPPQIIKAKYGDSGGVRGAAFLNIK